VRTIGLDSLQDERLGTQFEYGQLTNITELRHTGLGLGNY